MKNLRLTICTIFAGSSLFLSTAVQGQNVAINSTGAAADASAILDVTSASKGVLIPRVSLQSLSDAVTITSPANSLLVYNTNAALTGGTGFYFNSGTSGSPSWSKLLVNNSGWNITGNAGTTPGTDYLGTSDSTDLVMKTNNTQRMRISGAGITKFGDGTNDLVIDPDGSFSLEGNATAFNDITVPLFNSRLGQTNQAQWAQVKTNGSGSRGVYTFTFQDQSSASNEEEVFFTVQLPHNWKEGTVLYPHLHWSPQGASTGNVVWGLEYSWINYDATTPLAFPNTTLITATTAAIASGDVDKHLITAFSSLTPGVNNNKISSILMCRLYRKSADAADTYTGNAAVLSFDFHYEIDGVGSHSLYVK